MGFDYEEISDIAYFEAEYRPNEKTKPGKGLKLELNQDILTAEYLEQSIKGLKKIAEDDGEQSEDLTIPVETDLKEQAKTAVEHSEESLRNVQMMARVLGGRPISSELNNRVIRKWNLTRKGEEVEISFEEFLSWKITDLLKLYNFCLYEATAVKKKNSSK